MLAEGTFEGRSRSSPAGAAASGALSRSSSRLEAGVVVAGRRPEPLDETVGLIEGQGGKALAHSTDVPTPTRWMRSSLRR